MYARDIMITLYIMVEPSRKKQNRSINFIFLKKSYHFSVGILTILFFHEMLESLRLS